MWSVPVDIWIGDAAAVVSRGWGAVSRRAHETGYRRTSIYNHAHRVVQAVVNEQAGGVSDGALWADNARLHAENEALWEAWTAAEQLSEAKQQAFAATGSAMGLSLGQILLLLAIVLPKGSIPSRATVGRWVGQASRQAGRLLAVLDQCYQRLVLVLCLDDIVCRRAPILMVVEPHSMAWVAGQCGPDRSEDSWCEVLMNWPCVERVITDAGKGLERGVKLANEAWAAAAKGQEQAPAMAIEMGLDVFRPEGGLNDRQGAQGQLHAAIQLLTGHQSGARCGACSVMSGSLKPLDWVQEQLIQAVEDPLWREAFARLWCLRETMTHTPGEKRVRLAQLVALDAGRGSSVCDPSGRRVYS